MIRYAAGALAAVIVAGAAPAAALSPIEIVNRHIAAGADVDAILTDYADDAVVLQSGQARQGKAAIRALYERMFPKRPAATAPAATTGGLPSGAPAMKVLRVWQEGDVGLVSWQLGSISATEEFLVRDSKIEVQALFMTGVAPPSR